MRGKGHFRRKLSKAPGITPAYAGKRSGSAEGSGMRQDHPRLCGEKDLLKKIGLIEIGSPPPMRGKVDVQTEDGTPDRITPAYAGKRLRSTDFSDVDKDHPRLCGEKIFLCFVIMALIGSPPPMRGKDQAFQPLYMQHRITPAYAGKRPAL